MATKMFVNLPVKDLKRSVDFFTKLGFTFDPRFTDENATCMIVGDDNFVMLLVEKFFKTFIKKEINDSSKSTEVIVSISEDSRKKVDEIIDKAFKAGAVKYSEPMDMDWMYQKSFQDPDGHLWEFFYMDISKMPVPESTESK